MERRKKRKAEKLVSVMLLQKCVIVQISFGFFSTIHSLSLSLCLALNPSQFIETGRTGVTCG